MDAIVAALLNLGIGGMMAASVVIFAWWMTTRTIPELLEQREKDISWARDQIEKQRVSFLDALEKQQNAYLIALERQQAALSRSEIHWEHAVEKLCSEIRDLRSDLADERAAATASTRSSGSSPATTATTSFS